MNIETNPLYKKFFLIAQKKGFFVKQPRRAESKSFVNVILQGVDSTSSKPKESKLWLKPVPSRKKSKWIWVELKNNKGQPGWLYGLSDFIVFEMGHEYIFVSREDLLNHVLNNVDFNQPITSLPWQGKYRVYQRPNSFDQICQINLDKILKLTNTYCWQKDE